MTTVLDLTESPLPQPPEPTAKRNDPVCIDLCGSDSDPENVPPDRAATAASPPPLWAPHAARSPAPGCQQAASTLQATEHYCVPNQPHRPPPITQCAASGAPVSSSTSPGCGAARGTAPGARGPSGGALPDYSPTALTAAAGGRRKRPRRQLARLYECDAGEVGEELGASNGSGSASGGGGAGARLPQCGGSPRADDNWQPSVSLLTGGGRSTVSSGAGGGSPESVPYSQPTDADAGGGSGGRGHSGSQRANRARLTSEARAARDADKAAAQAARVAERAARAAAKEAAKEEKAVERRNKQMLTGKQSSGELLAVLSRALADAGDRSSPGGDLMRHLRSGIATWRETFEYDHCSGVDGLDDLRVLRFERRVAADHPLAAAAGGGGGASRVLEDGRMAVDCPLLVVYFTAEEFVGHCAADGFRAVLSRLAAALAGGAALALLVQGLARYLNTAAERDNRRNAPTAAGSFNRSVVDDVVWALQLEYEGVTLREVADTAEGAEHMYCIARKLAKQPYQQETCYYDMHAKMDAKSRKAVQEFQGRLEAAAPGREWRHMEPYVSALWCLGSSMDAGRAAAVAARFPTMARLANYCLGTSASAAAKAAELADLPLLRAQANTKRLGPKAAAALLRFFGSTHAADMVGGDE